MKVKPYFNVFEKKITEMYNKNVVDEVVRTIRDKKSGKQELVEKTT